MNQFCSMRLANPYVLYCILCLAHWEFISIIIQIRMQFPCSPSPTCGENPRVWTSCRYLLNDLPKSGLPVPHRTPPWWRIRWSLPTPQGKESTGACQHFVRKILDRTNYNKVLPVSKKRSAVNGSFGCLWQFSLKRGRPMIVGWLVDGSS